MRWSSVYWPLPRRLARPPAVPIVEIKPPAVAPPIETPQPRAEEVPARVLETPVVPLIAAAATVAPPRVDVAWPTAPEVFVPWRVRHLGNIDVLDALPARSAALAVSAALSAVVDMEGPIHTDRLAQLVANGFGLRRVAETRKTAILRHLPRALRRDSAESVIWPAARVPEEWEGSARTRAAARDRQRDGARSGSRGWDAARGVAPRGAVCVRVAKADPRRDSAYGRCAGARCPLRSVALRRCHGCAVLNGAEFDAALRREAQRWLTVRTNDGRLQTDLPGVPARGAPRAVPAAG